MWEEQGICKSIWVTGGYPGHRWEGLIRRGARIKEGSYVGWLGRRRIGHLWESRSQLEGIYKMLYVRGGRWGG
jgi:hypothetical protein